MQSQELQGELGGVPAVAILGYHQTPSWCFAHLALSLARGPESREVTSPLHQNGGARESPGFRQCRIERGAITGIDTVWMAGALALTVLPSLHLALSGEGNSLSRTFRMRGSGVSRLASMTPFACVSTTF